MALLITISCNLSADIVIITDGAMGDTVADSADHKTYDLDVFKTSKLGGRYGHWDFLRIRTPSLWDTDIGIGVTITSTVAQAEADLAISIRNAMPAVAKFRGTDIREEVRNSRARAAAARAVPELRAEVEKQADIIEAILEQLERLNARP